jgi:hypothetical protein
MGRARQRLYTRRAAAPRAPEREVRRRPASRARVDPEVDRGLASATVSRLSRLRPQLLLSALMLLSSLAVYIPFRGAMDKVCRYWDGPPYLYVAKTLYQVPEQHPFTPYGLPASYFANHLPGYPLLIRALTPLTLGDYPMAMLLATLLTSMGAVVLFYQLLVSYRLVRSPVWTAVLFCFLPPRFVIYHAVGASEPLFLCCVFAAFLALKAERPAWVAVFAALGSLTRMPGALLVPIFGLIYLTRGQWRRAIAMSLGGLGLLCLFTYYHFVFGDFWAYFTWAARETHMMAAPFAKFSTYAGTAKLHSIELFAAVFLAYGLGTLSLWKRRELFIYAATYWLFCTMINHADVPRLILVIAPFALLVAFDEQLSRPAARLLLPLAIFFDYSYAWGYLPHKLVGRGVYQELLEVLSR